MITRTIIDFGRARYAFVQIRAGNLVMTAYARSRRCNDWRKLERMAMAATVQAQ